MWVETFPRYAHVVLSPYTPPEASGEVSVGEVRHFW